MSQSGIYPSCMIEIHAWIILASDWLSLCRQSTSPVESLSPSAVGEPHGLI